MRNAIRKRRTPGRIESILLVIHGSYSGAISLGNRALNLRSDLVAQPSNTEVGQISF